MIARREYGGRGEISRSSDRDLFQSAPWQGLLSVAGVQAWTWQSEIRKDGF